jgi:hypothetical protein
MKLASKLLIAILACSTGPAFAQSTTVNRAVTETEVISAQQN